MLDHLLAHMLSLSSSTVGKACTNSVQEVCANALHETCTNSVHAVGKNSVNAAVPNSAVWHKVPDHPVGKDTLPNGGGKECSLVEAERLTSLGGVSEVTAGGGMDSQREAGEAKCLATAGGVQRK